MWVASAPFLVFLAVPFGLLSGLRCRPALRREVYSGDVGRTFHINQCAQH